MSKNNRVLEELKNIYQITHNQCVFIESKNGALVVFNIAVVTIFISNNLLNSCILKFAVAGLFISCFFSFSSFSPSSYNCKNIKPIDDWNYSLIYFRYIAKEYGIRNAELYVKNLCESLGEIFNFENNSLVYSYANEIVVLSSIIEIKHSAFRRARTITIFSLILTMLGLLL